MATVTGLTAARMQAIEAASVVDGSVDVSGDLILEKYDGSTINAGSVIGPKGDPGADAAPGSVTPVGDTTPIRTSDARVKGADPTESDDLTSKSYVDTSLGLKANQTSLDTLEDIVLGQALNSTDDLNDFKTTGVWFQSNDTNADTARNYPITGRSGVLEVFSNSNVGSVTQVYQRYTARGSDTSKTWTRSWVSGVWYQWYLKDALDYGWVNVTWKSGFTDYGTSDSYTVQTRRLSNQAFMKGLVKRTSGDFLASTSYDIADVNFFAIPNRTYYMAAATSTGDSNGMIIVTSAGLLQLRTGTTDSPYYSMAANWLLD